MAPETGIMEAVQRGNVEQCARLIQRDSSVLTEKGWGGFTALHFAALHGNRAVAELLLDSGADTNAPCHAGHTPFHFACRHGNVHVVHKMLQLGAELKLRDHQGRNALHHATTGGSIVCVQYLWESGVFSFSDVDLALLTPLHMAVIIANTDLVRYLLRNNRCAVEAVDSQGVSALHVAAERGSVEVSWLLLQHAGVSLLHTKTHAGHTPLQLCNRGTTYRHRELSKLLSYYEKKPLDYKPTDSHGVYYWTLLLPSLSGGVVLLISVAMGEYGGVASGILFPILAKATLTQYHRISSYQRFPNPVYLGTLSAGILHSTVCLFYKIIPSVWPATVLLRVCVLECSVLLLLFWNLVRRDPGAMTTADAHPKYTTVTQLIQSQESLQRFCTHCELFQVDNSKHCRLCGICVLDYDHHCLFLNRCVGRGNHRLFLLFLVAMVSCHVLFLIGAGLYLWPLLLGGEEPVTAVMGREAWVLGLAVMNALTMAWLLWLLWDQYRVVSVGTTSYFLRPVEVGLTTAQRVRNFLLFLLKGRRVRGPDRGKAYAV
ncbi:putative ZDHHC-type palmitoyltransferase 6 [Engraulis encrasicolus]|uniref:putative ZDHHC-type palmitoyltransferase 6 n=1 Tax=Engraulis encrasicolus TaxID=184585 RepID=UPI002FD137BB